MARENASGATSGSRASCSSSASGSPARQSRTCCGGGGLAGASADRTDMVAVPAGPGLRHLARRRLTRLGPRGPGPAWAGPDPSRPGWRRPTLAADRVVPERCSCRCCPDRHLRARSGAAKPSEAESTSPDAGVRGRYPLAALAPATDRLPSLRLPVGVTECMALARVCASRLNLGQRPVGPRSSPAYQRSLALDRCFGSALNSKPPRDRVLAPNRPRDPARRRRSGRAAGGDLT
jgi:hypothetical protein